jgi:hypothetical protein
VLNFLDPAKLKVAIDLTEARAGLQRYRISDKDITLPLGLNLAGVSPSQVFLRLRKKPPEPGEKG